ncbi:MAG TPA: methyltransferase domain-containing protein [Steroidobacteraceae bacterium]|nr:methyltransferase domain-containing protein [Steroidobacteraceae bacterium]
MSGGDAVKVGQVSEPGEYDPGMLTLLQIIWGEGFLSPGGAEEVERLLEGSDIGDCEVLDIGCGLGAIDELLITRHGARSVVGVDIDPALLEQMQRRIERAGLSGRVRCRRVDAGPLPFPDASFDVVFSKDAMVQIPDKPRIFAEILRVLRPAGRFIASDWLRGGSGAYSAEMMEFFRLEGIAYNMVTLDESAAALRAAGFVDVEIRDRHGWYLELAQRELAALDGVLKSRIVEGIGAERAQHFIDDWRQLVVVLRRGELRPGHLKAAKSA